MVGPGENELRTDEKGMLMFTYKELPDNDFDLICWHGLWNICRYKIT